MAFPSELDVWLKLQGFGPVVATRSLSGGCINNASLIETKNGGKLFVKYRGQVPPFFFESEAEGLGYLKMACNIRVPTVVGFGDEFLVLEYIESAPHRSDFWELLGQQLAHIHSCTRNRFGFVNDNFCGETPQVNTFDENGHRFFAKNRLLYLASMAYDKKLLDRNDLSDIERVCRDLPILIPEQPASLLHGDLWSGNVHVGSIGEPVFIDPSVYFGWAEIDLAMTRLFGGFPVQFYDAYNESRPLEQGWQDRLDLYNLYPLLNHLNLFGSGYLSQIRTTLHKYCA